LAIALKTSLVRCTSKIERTSCDLASMIVRSSARTAGFRDILSSSVRSNASSSALTSCSMAR